MKINWNEKYTTIAVYALLVICGGIFFYIAVSRIEITFTFLTKVKNLLLPFAYGFSIAYLLNPLCNWLENTAFAFLNKKKPRKKLTRALAIVVTYIVTLMLIAGAIMFVIPQMASNLKVISVNIPGYYDNILQFIHETLTKMGVPDSVVTTQIDELYTYLQGLLNKSSELITTILPYVYDVTKSFTTVLLNLVVGTILSIYVLLSKERIFAQCKKLLFAILKAPLADRLIEITRSSNKIFSGFISGKIIDSLLLGVLCFLGMSIFRFPYALLISVIVAISNIIPYFGPIIGAIPSILLVLLVNPMQGLGFAAFILVLQQFDGNVLEPKILGESTGLTPLWVVFAVIVGGGLFGILGMFVGVPLFSVIYSLIKEYLNGRLAKKGLSTKTTDYASEHHKL